MFSKFHTYFLDSNLLLEACTMLCRISFEPKFVDKNRVIGGDRCRIFTSRHTAEYLQVLSTYKRANRWTHIQAGKPLNTYKRWLPTSGQAAEDIYKRVDRWMFTRGQAAEDLLVVASYSSLPSHVHMLLWSQNTCIEKLRGAACNKPWGVLEGHIIRPSGAQEHDFNHVEIMLEI